MTCVATVVIPAYNEAGGLNERLDRLTEKLELLLGTSFELLAVDDGSTDDTGRILAEATQRIPQLRVVTHASNRGLDAAIRSGVDVARGHWIVTYDADLTYAPETIAELIRVARESEAVIAVASPYMHGGRCIAVPWWRLVLSRGANWYLAMATNARVSTWTSIVRAYRSHVAHALLEEGAFDEATFAVLMRAIGEGLRVVEVPATLDWSQQPKKRAARLRIKRICRHTWRVLGAGLRARPSLWIAIPGLIPGLLPIVAGIGWMLRLPATTLAVLSVCTAVLQYASLTASGFTVLSGVITCRRSTQSQRICQTIKTTPVVASEPRSSPPSVAYSLLER